MSLSDLVRGDELPSDDSSDESYVPDEDNLSFVEQVIATGMPDAAGLELWEDLSDDDGEEDEGGGSDEEKVPDEGGGEVDDDDDDDEVKAPPSGQSFGVPYPGFANSDDSSDSSDGPDDEVRFSHERYFTPRLSELLRGSMLGGDPASATGLLTGIGPMLLHQSDSPHPERPARMVAIYEELIARGLDRRSRLVPARAASAEDLRLVHAPEHVALATRRYASDAEATGSLGLDSDTYFSGGDSGRAASLSAGSVVELTTRVMQGELRNALAVVRPPGHHCEEKQAMGFCVLNNVCVAAAVARRRLEAQRVLVLDWDVHHGNGVQHIFEEDPSVLYVSLHRYGEGFYPGTGHPTETGQKEGIGTSVNVAWSRSGYGDAEYLAAFDRVIMPISREFGPDLVIVSAGFDAADGDPLGGMMLSPAGYAHMTALLSTLANGKIVVALEGGYDLRAIAASAAAVHEVLLGEAPPALARAAPARAALVDIEATASALAPYWRSIRGPALGQRYMARKQQKRKKKRRDGGVRKRRGSRWWWRYL